MLRLAALDADDLAVISAQMQDAVLKVGDIAWRRPLGQFAIVANRYAWEENDSRERRRTGLHFNRVREVRAKGVRPASRDEILALLAITFEPGDGVAGTLVLHFSGGASIRLDVESIEASLKDLGPAWATSQQPHHEEG